MLDGIEVEFPAVDRSQTGFLSSGLPGGVEAAVAQLQPSPHQFTNL